VPPREAPRIALAVFAAIAALGLTACGSSKSDSAKARDTVKSFLSAAARGDGGKACDQLSTPTQGQINAAGQGSCSSIIGRLNGRLSSDQQTKVDKIDPKVTVHGNTATATYQSVTGPGTRTVLLVKENGNWKISGLPTGGN
jgi:hypothetical protein